jgi:MoaA/NifB/PqqE/SkfB family radical SAM enzyme
VACDESQMLMRIFACIDELVNMNPAGGHALRGWIVADFKITQVAAELQSGSCHRIAYGHLRPDVARVYPEQSASGRCGFSLVLPGENAVGRGFLWLADNAGNWVKVSINWDSRAPQESTVAKEDFSNEAPVAVAELLDAWDHTEVEENVKQWLENAPRLRLRIDLINRCNLRCVMCHYNNPAYTSKPRNVVSLEEFKSFFEPIGKYVKEALLSCADEPLLAPEFTDVLYYLGESFPHVRKSFCTNATLFDVKAQKAVIESRVEQVMVSLDGVTPATYEAIRKGAKFDRVAKNLINFAKLKAAVGVSWPELQVNLVMMKSNIHEAPALIETVHALGGVSMSFHHAVPTNGIDVGDEKLLLHPALFNFYREKILETCKRLGVKVYIPDPLPDDGSTVIEAKACDDHYIKEMIRNHELEQPELTDLHPPIKTNSIGISEVYPEVFCEMPFSEVYVANQEKVLPCPYQKLISVPLKDQESLMSAFFSDPFAELRKAMLTPEGHPGCAGCPIKHGELQTQNTEF